MRERALRPADVRSIPGGVQAPGDPSNETTWRTRGPSACGLGHLWRRTNRPSPLAAAVRTLSLMSKGNQLWLKDSLFEALPPTHPRKKRQCRPRTKKTRPVKVLPGQMKFPFAKED